MLLSSINPFIRFAQTITFENTLSDTVSYDSRLFYITSGSCILQIKDKEYSLYPGTLLIWKCGTHYKFIAKRRVEIISVNFDYTQNNAQKKNSISPVSPDEFIENKLFENITFSDFGILNEPIIMINKHHIEPTLGIITDEFSKKKLGYDSLCSALLKKIIIETARLALINIAENSHKLDRTILYIEQNYNKDISNEKLAAISGYHPYHLNRLMKNSTGMTLHQYIINLRIKKATDMLLNTTIPISEIAETCGFKNSYYFSAAFKSKTGITPSAFRNSRKNIL